MQFLITLFALLPLAICGVQPPVVQPADIDSQTHLSTSHAAAVGTIEVYPVPSPVPTTGPTTFSTVTTSHSRVHQSDHSGTVSSPPLTVNISTALEVPVTVTVTVTEFSQSVLFTSVASDTTNPELVPTTSSDAPTDTTHLENWPSVTARSVPSDTVPAVFRDVLTGYKLQCTNQPCSSICICSDEGVLQCQLGPTNAPDCPADCKCLETTTTTSGLPGIPTPTTPPMAAHSQPQKRVTWSSTTCNTMLEVCSTSTTSSTTDSMTLPFISPPAVNVVDTGVAPVPAASSTSTSLTGSATMPFTSETDSMTLPFTTPNINSMTQKFETPVSLVKPSTTRSLPWESTTPQPAHRGDNHLEIND